MAVSTGAVAARPSVHDSLVELHKDIEGVHKMIADTFGRFNSVLHQIPPSDTGSHAKNTADDSVLGQLADARSKIQYVYRQLEELNSRCAL
jgi:hypothetical protein